jgi:hypothetical protein
MIVVVSNYFKFKKRMDKNVFWFIEELEKLDDIIIAGKTAPVPICDALELEKIYNPEWIFLLQDSWDIVSNLEKVSCKKAVFIEDCHPKKDIKKFEKIKFDKIFFNYREAMEDYKNITYSELIWMPHFIHTSKSYKKLKRKNKIYDVFMFGCTIPELYPFRHRLKNICRKLAQEKKIEYVEWGHPGYKSHHTHKTGLNLTNMLNKSWLTVIGDAVRLNKNYVVKKYFECLAAGSGPISKPFDELIEVIGNDFVSLDENMSDEKIEEIILNALKNKKALEPKIKKMQCKVMSLHTQNQRIPQILSHFRKEKDGIINTYYYRRDDWSKDLYNGVVEELKKEFIINENVVDFYNNKNEIFHTKKLFIYENNKTKKFLVYDTSDHANSARIKPLQKHENCSCIMKVQYNANINVEDNVVPHFYYAKWINITEKIREKLIQIPKIKKNIYFKGALRAGRGKVLKFLKEMGIFENNTSKVGYEQYLQEIAEHKIALSLPGVGNCCHREFEIMAVGTCVIMPKLINSYKVDLIPDHHYISIDIDMSKLSSKEIAEKIFERYNEVIDDDEYLRFIAQNGLEYYNTYCTLENTSKITKDMIIQYLDL